MKKNNVLKFFEEIEAKDPVLKKWGELLDKEEKIIDKIVSTRKEKNMSQKELAKMTGLRQPAIARIENKIHSPQLDTLLKLVDALDLEFDIKDLDEQGRTLNEEVLELHKHHIKKYTVLHTLEFNSVYRLTEKEENNEYSSIKHKSQEVTLAC